MRPRWTKLPIYLAIFYLLALRQQLSCEMKLIANQNVNLPGCFRE